MNSLEITAYKAFVAHRKAFDIWENGSIDKVWLDDNKDICLCLYQKDPYPWGIYETSLMNVPPEVLRELEEMVDNRRKQLLRR